ncbi:helix-turn-helix domain-containing protein [Lysobacter niabensis]|uniref:helix-turn-helix domain-containing protein n=1 Tax=Agrilutibacter niabensis TaxID=380628 RepID=UPI003616C660
MALADALARIDASDGGTLGMSDLCASAGVSERTLRVLFKDAFGVTPTRYIRSRKLRLVHAALASAVPGRARVSAIGGQFGFNDLGRMAADYHALFGEYPSQTLRRAPQDLAPAQAALPSRYRRGQLG